MQSEDKINIIVRMPNWIGDFMMALPVLELIRKQYPKAVVSVLLKKYLIGLLLNNQHIDHILAFEKKSEIGALLKNKQFDVGVLLTNSFSSALFFYLANIKKIIGYKGHFRGCFLDIKEKINRKLHQRIAYQQLLAHLDIFERRNESSLRLQQYEIQDAEELLQQNQWIKHNKTIGIHPSASYGLAKCWPKEHFKQLIEMLDLEKCNVILFGDRAMKKIAEFLCINKKIINLSGKTSLRQMAAIFYHLDLYLTNDSGPMHIADAMKRPILALFGSTSYEQTGPVNKNAHVIQKKINCAPCFKRKRCKDFICMKQISPKEVLLKIKEILSL